MNAPQKDFLDYIHSPGTRTDKPRQNHFPGRHCPRKNFMPCGQYRKYYLKIYPIDEIAAHNNSLLISMDFFSRKAG
jgi:hypothetical protein